VVGDVCRVRLSGENFDHAAEDDVAAVAVLLPGARLEGLGCGADRLHHGGHADVSEVRAHELSDAAAMRKQMTNGDPGRSRVIRVVGEMVRQRVVERQTATLNQLRHGDGGECLVDGPEIEPRVRGTPPGPGGIREAVGGLDFDGLIATDQCHA
jgi:hypothetical protein